MIHDNIEPLLVLPPLHPISVAVYAGVLILASSIFHPGCNDRAVRLARAFRGLLKALRR